MSLLSVALLTAGGDGGTPTPLPELVKTLRATARAGEKDRAFALLDQAIAQGFRNVKAVKGDADFAPLRSDPRYAPALDKLEASAHPCARSAEARQLDFWLGEWDVAIKGGGSGRSRIERLLDGCALQEHWDGPGTSGKSLNFYDVSAKRWRQVWVDDAAGVIDFTGEKKGTTMEFRATTHDPQGKPQLLRMTFTPRSSNEVQQLIEDSVDGQRWNPQFEGIYRRRQ